MLHFSRQHLISSSLHFGNLILLNLLMHWFDTVRATHGSTELLLIPLFELSHRHQRVHFLHKFTITLFCAEPRPKISVVYNSQLGVDWSIPLIWIADKLANACRSACLVVIIRERGVFRRLIWMYACLSINETLSHLSHMNELLCTNRTLI